MGDGENGRPQATELQNTRTRVKKPTEQPKPKHNGQTHKKTDKYNNSRKRKKKNLPQNFNFVRSIFGYNRIGFVQLTKPPKIV